MVRAILDVSDLISIIGSILFIGAAALFFSSVYTYQLQNKVAANLAAVGSLPYGYFLLGLSLGIVLTSTILVFLTYSRLQIEE